METVLAGQSVSILGDVALPGDLADVLGLGRIQRLVTVVLRVLRHLGHLLQPRLAEVVLAAGPVPSLGLVAGGEDDIAPLVPQQVVVAPDEPGVPALVLPNRTCN